MAKLNINEIKKNAVHVKENDYSYIDGKFLRSLRMGLKMSQVLFAEYLGVSKKAIEKWEQGKNKVNGTVQRMLFLIEHDPSILSKLREIKVDDQVVIFKKVDVFKYCDIVYTNVTEIDNIDELSSYSSPIKWNVQNQSSRGGNSYVTSNI